jgi:hypothetical protein
MVIRVPTDSESVTPDKCLKLRDHTPKMGPFRPDF